MKQAQPRTRGSTNVGAKGSSSITATPPYLSLFHTRWGEERYFDEVKKLHGMPTQGQRDGLIAKIRLLETKVIADEEYQSAMEDIELYEKLVEEGKGK